MGRLRTTSFYLVHDPDAPDEGSLSRAQIEKIELAHAAGKEMQIADLVKSMVENYNPNDGVPSDDASRVNEFLADALRRAPHGSALPSVITDATDLSMEGRQEALDAAWAAFMALDTEIAGMTGTRTTEAGMRVYREARAKYDAEKAKIIAMVDKPAVVLAAYTAAQVIEPYPSSGTREEKKEYLERIIGAVRDMDPRSQEARAYRKVLPGRQVRRFAGKVIEILASEPSFPTGSYKTTYKPPNVVRFDDDGYLVLTGLGGVSSQLESETSGAYWTRLQEAKKPLAIMRIAEGEWATDGNWGGFLQVTSAANQHKWIESKNGWAGAFSSKDDKVTFYDMGNYYEIWQWTREDEKGKPLTVENDKLRFVKDAVPARWNIEDR
ncbi:hypothetical protein [Streptomyces sp. NPDC004435]|uniref:hypothetical protein n=1 Tax=Streptomyces sp. NPDC004435 TaxID=3364701 RepID=UPI0036C62DDA